MVKLIFRNNCWDASKTTQDFSTISHFTSSLPPHLFTNKQCAIQPTVNFPTDNIRQRLTCSRQRLSSAEAQTDTPIVTGGMLHWRQRARQPTQPSQCSWPIMAASCPQSGTLSSFILDAVRWATGRAVKAATTIPKSSLLEVLLTGLT